MNNELIAGIGENIIHSFSAPVTTKKGQPHTNARLPEILVISSYPPRECGIATYSQDLIKALNEKFGDSFSIKICALEAGNTAHVYPKEVKYVLDTSDVSGYATLANAINADHGIHCILIQHEFGFFHQAGEMTFLQFLYRLTKPVATVFHTVLPHPNEMLKMNVHCIAAASESIIVMTDSACKVLMEDYGVSGKKIEVIAHGTHLVPHLNKESLKEKYGLAGRKTLSTFGLLSSGKSIETTLEALPAIVEKHPDVMFMIIGKTHPGVVRSEGENYRSMLQAKVKELQLEENVTFVNRYLPLEDLLEYLQMTDIYLFTSKDPNQAVSGTFSYAMSCGCAIISTPIPHAREALRDDNSIFIDFQNSQQLSDNVNRLLGDDSLRRSMSANILQQIVPSAWENTAIAFALLFRDVSERYHFSNTKSENGHSAFHQRNIQSRKIALEYRLPDINLDHVKNMTTDIGMIQFSQINQPDLNTGYTIDDNARALIAICMHYEMTRDAADLNYMRIYLNFIQFCQQPEGDFLNYVDRERDFTTQNEENLSDANGRAIWALGFLISKGAILPKALINTAQEILDKAIPHAKQLLSTRTMAFVIKGLYYANQQNKSPEYTAIIKTLSNRLVQMYRHESEQNWNWYESYLTYGNSVLPEALLCAWLEIGDPVYKEIAKTSFDFLLSLTFKENRIKVISNKSWLQKGEEPAEHGEQPIDVAYTIMALSKFYQEFREPLYLNKMQTAFNWFLGNNHLHQIVYNPCTGGCYDGLEDTHVNLNQGAESTLSYLMARLTIPRMFPHPVGINQEKHSGRTAS